MPKQSTNTAQYLIGSDHGLTFNRYNKSGRINPITTEARSFSKAGFTGRIVRPQNTIDRCDQVPPIMLPLALDVERVLNF